MKHNLFYLEQGKIHLPLNFLHLVAV